MINKEQAEIINVEINRKGTISMKVREAIKIALCLIFISSQASHADDIESKGIDRNNILSVLTSIENQCNELGGYLGAMCVGFQMELINEIKAFCNAKDCQSNMQSLDDFNNYAVERLKEDLKHNSALAKRQERTIELKMNTVCSLVNSAYIAKGLLKFEPNKALPGYDHSKEDVDSALLALQDHEDVLFGVGGCLSRQSKG